MSFSYRGAVLLGLASGLTLSACPWFPSAGLIWWATGTWSLPVDVSGISLWLMIPCRRVCPEWKPMAKAAIPFCAVAKRGCGHQLLPL